MVYWYAQGILAALTFLFTMRISLFHILENGDTFETQSFQALASCPFANKSLRTYDGRCNRLNSMEMGGKGVRFGRVCPFNISIPETGDRLLAPNPKLVADKLLYRQDNVFVPETHVNVLAAAFLQFQTHDWFTHINDDLESDPIVIPHGDSTIKVARTQKDPGFDDSERVSQTFINTQTPWWDLEPIYGSKEFSKSQRTLSGGKFLFGSEGRIPINPESGIEFAGVDNNWWVGLSLMHNLYTREHNAIAEMLAKAYPRWTDDELFEKARMINCAVNAKIHTLEWTPALLQDDILQCMQIGMVCQDSRELSAKPWMPTSQIQHFSIQKNSYLSIRMHPMLPDSFDFKPLFRSKNKNTKVSMLDVAFTNSTSWVEKYGLADIANSMGVQSQGKLTLLNYPTFLRDIKTPTHAGQVSPGQTVDLAMIEIIRDRERGIPRYNAYRRSVNMESLTKMDQITTDPKHLALLNEVYGGNVEQVDLLVGQLAEETRPPGFGFSDTTFRLFIATASRRLMADRFFTDSYNEETYTKEGLDWIKAANMKKVLIRNIPELRFALAKVANPFIPWNNVIAQAQWLQIIAKSGADLAKLGVDVVFGAIMGKKVMPHS